MSPQDALDEYVPTACDLLMMDAEGRHASALLLDAARAFDAGHLERCATAASKCAAAAWQLLQGTPSEAVLHAHALAHAMLAATETWAAMAILRFPGKYPAFGGHIGKRFSWGLLGP